MALSAEHARAPIGEDSQPILGNLNPPLCNLAPLLTFDDGYVAFLMTFPAPDVLSVTSLIPHLRHIHCLG